MAEFLHNSDAFTWSIKSDPRLRSTIVTLVLLDRSPDWNELVNRFESLSRRVPTFRERVVASPAPAPPRWEFDSDFDLALHLRRVAAAAPGTIDTLLEMSRLAAMADFDRARPLWEVTLIDGLADGGAALLCEMHHSLTDGIGAVEIAMTLYDETEQDDQRPMSAAASAQAAGQAAELGPLAGIRDTVAFEAGLAASAFTGSVKAAPGLIVSSARHPVRTATAAAPG